MSKELNTPDWHSEDAGEWAYDVEDRAAGGQVARRLLEAPESSAQRFGAVVGDWARAEAHRLAGKRVVATPLMVSHNLD